MKVNVVSGTMVVLTPESEADNALLQLWGDNYTARTGSVGADCFPDGSKTYSVGIQFQLKERSTDA